MRALARRVFTVDIRSLSLMRIGVAATVLIDLLVRMLHLTEHYTDDGVLPLAAALRMSSLVHVSLLSLHGSMTWALLVFLFALVLSVAVMIGWRTRLTTLLLWLCVLSIQHRNPLLSDHRDHLIACMLLFGLLLPWGRALSLDSRRERAADPAYFGAPAAAYIVQIVCIYLFAVLFKKSPQWRTEYTAVHYALSVEYWSMPAAKALLAFPGLTKLLTFLIFWFEAAVVILILSPFRTAALRTAAVVGVSLMQVGFAAFIWLGTFPMISIAAMLGLLPAAAFRSRVFCKLAGEAGEPGGGDGRPAGDARPIKDSLPIQCVALLALFCTLALNLLSLKPSASPLAEAANKAGELLRLNQRWDMFAPAPTKIDGWFVVVGTRSDGAVIDLLSSGRAMDWSRPDSFHGVFRTTRELVYFRRLLRSGDVPRLAYAAAQCRKWSGNGALPLSLVEVYFLRKTTEPSGGAESTQKQRLVELTCPASARETLGGRREESGR